MLGGTLILIPYGIVSDTAVHAQSQVDARDAGFSIYLFWIFLSGIRWWAETYHDYRDSL